MLYIFSNHFLAYRKSHTLVMELKLTWWQTNCQLSSIRSSVLKLLLLLLFRVILWTRTFGLVNIIYARIEPSKLVSRYNFFSMVKSFYFWKRFSNQVSSVYNFVMIDWLENLGPLFCPVNWVNHSSPTRRIFLSPSSGCLVLPRELINQLLIQCFMCMVIPRDLFGLVFRRLPENRCITL